MGSVVVVGRGEKFYYLREFGGMGGSSIGFLEEL